MADSLFDVRDSRFESCIKASARLDHLWGEGRWAEGPAYFPASRSLLWSDIPNDRLMRWDETTGATGVFRSGLGLHSNGNTVDRQGRLVSCEHGTRRVTRTEHDGSVAVLVERFDGKRLNSPNDAVVRSDGSIWFSDPSYGIESDYEGFRAESEIGGDHVYRLDPESGELRIVADDFVRPNGLAFSPDESLLYVADSGTPRHLRVFEASPAAVLSGGSVFAECEAGIFDGFRIDTDGRIWAGAGDGVHCLHPDGTLLGKVRVPEPVSNVCFGGLKRNRLFMTATGSVYSVMLPVNGVKTF